MTTTQHTVAGTSVTVDDTPATGTDDGPVLVLHGGGGPATVAGFAGLLAARTGRRVLVPTHPGFAGTPPPATPTDARGLAAIYAALLDELDLTGVTVLGNSFGGWVAAEVALLNDPRVRAVVVVDGIGVEVEGHPMTDVAGLSAAQLAALSFHDPSRAPRPPAGEPAPKPDIAALVAYTGPAMVDPSLRARLAGVDVPVQVLWGESDGIVDVDYGRAYADAIPGAAFTVLPGTGHLPQVETPDALLAALTLT